MPLRTDNSTVSEPDSHSDSDWLDIASTDRDSDDNDSICSSRETDHEDPSRSRSRRSSLSYGSSRDGDVDAWEGLIEDSAGDGMSNDVLTPSPHVASPFQHSPTFDVDHAQDASPEELRVKEGLDQSMISTLSSSRSSSLHSSTVHSSTRDLRLSFPDPITSSCRELPITPPEEIQHYSDLSSAFPDPVAPLDACRIDDGEPCDLKMLLSQLPSASIPAPSGPELKVFLFGSPAILKWSIVNRLVQKVACGAGVTIDVDLESLEGPIRQLTVSGSFEHDRAFPRTITVFDRTFQSHGAGHDPALTDISDVRPLAIVFMPCPPLALPEHVLHLPIILSACSNERLEFADTETNSRTTSNILNIPTQQILRIAGPEGPLTIEQDSIDMIESARAYQGFSRLWSGDNVPKGIMASTHALTIIAILSLILGLVVRAALPVSLQQFAPPTLPALPINYTSCSLWQMIRPAPYRERLPASTTLDNSVVMVPSPFKDSLSVFSAESTSVTLSRANPTSFRGAVSPTLSERKKISKELILQPPCSVLPTDDRPKALSVVPGTRPSKSYPPTPDPTGHAVSTLRHVSVPDIVKECASVLTIVNQDMQDIFDALDALVQAISRQTQMILAQATTFIEQSSVYMEKSVESFEMVKGTLRTHNERAKKRAKQIREKGTKWLFEASEVVTTSARFSTVMARDLAGGLAHRAQRAKGKAKEMATELQDFLNEAERLEVLGTAAWDSHMKYWDEWMERAMKQEKSFCKRKLKPSIFC